jgi:hypothetical protein
LFVGQLVLALAMSACADAPTEPSSPGPAVLEVSRQSAPFQNSLTARPGEPVAGSPSVVLRDGRGQPIAGALVRFVVTLGGGSVQFASVETDAQGLASAGEWTLGPLAGWNEVAAQVATLPEVRFRAEAIAPAFSISIRYITEPSAEYARAVKKAVRRWESIISRDLPDHPMQSAAASCFPSQPELNETVDDLVLYVDLQTMDGAGSYLGEAGPCYLRSTGLLPVMGFVKLDVSDLAQMAESGMLEDLLLHEIGHVLGVGTLWLAKGLLQGMGSEDPRVLGTQALDAYRQLGGLDAGVPAENSGSALTRDVHWRESVFSNELMTGYISSGPNPLSALTIATLQDLGYGATLDGANSFALGNAQPARTRLNLHEHERVVRPRFTIDGLGRRELINR